MKSDTQYLLDKPALRAAAEKFQGFLFSHALPIDALQRFLRQDGSILA